MDPVDRVVEEDGVIAGPVLGVVLWLVSHGNIASDQEFTVKAVDLFAATGPQRNVIDADRLVAVCEPSPGPDGWVK